MANKMGVGGVGNFLLNYTHTCGMVQLPFMHDSVTLPDVYGQLPSLYILLLFFHVQLLFFHVSYYCPYMYDSLILPPRVRLPPFHMPCYCPSMYMYDYHPYMSRYCPVMCHYYPCRTKKTTSHSSSRGASVTTLATSSERSTSTRACKSSLASSWPTRAATSNISISTTHALSALPCTLL